MKPRIPLLNLFVLLIGLLFSLCAGAHEIRPAYLEITENANQDIHVLWKQPTAGRLSLPMAPKLSSGWLDEDRSTLTFTDTYMIRQWRIAAPRLPLHGQSLTIEGLDKTITDVLVRINFANGATISQLLKPEHPGLEVLQPGKSTVPILEYLELGVTHIWLGIDHLLYIFGLMLLVRNTRMLIKTITAFTIAHSITLAAAALKIVSVRPAQIEAFIALSIVYVAVELVHLRQGRAGLAARYPWIVAFLFGLLHGFGFAGALAEIGLPDDAIPQALFLFNVGIELGQLAFVFLVLFLIRGLKPLWPRIEQGLERLAPYAIGSLASLWWIERSVHIF